MEDTNDASFIVQEEKERKIKKDIECNNFTSLITTLNLFDENSENNLLLDDDEISQMKGHAYYSLGSILLQDKHTNEDEKSIINAYNISKDVDKAILCFAKALTLGYSDAANKLFKIYYFDDDGKKDYEKAWQFCNIGVELFNTRSYFNKGIMLYEGLGVKKNYQLARKCFEISFMEDGKLGGYELGMMYEKALGVAENDEKAFEYFYGAAECGDKHACFKLGAILSGFYVDKYQTIEKRPDVAIECFNEYLKKCAPQKRINAVTSIGKIKFRSTEKKERADGVRKLVRSARNGDKVARDFLTKKTAYGSPKESVKTFDFSILDKSI